MTMDPYTRRQAILSHLITSQAPVNGSELAGLFQVSRQVIVQDIALLRANQHQILSTNKGYLLYQTTNTIPVYTDVIMVQHTAEETYAEMETILEYGGQMLDVFIDHDLYGQIRADLVIRSKEDALDFCKRMLRSSSKPLKELTGSSHYHTITAPSAKAAALIRKELAEKGILLPENKN